MALGGSISGVGPGLRGTTQGMLESVAKTCGGTVNAGWPKAPPPSSEGMHAALAGGVCRDADDTQKGLVGKPTKNGFSGVAGCSHGCGLTLELVVGVVSSVY
jgi:hypothetical protein